MPISNFFNINSRGQKAVNDDCSKFNPTNIVINNQYGDKKYPKIEDTRTIVPATILIMYSRFIFISLLVKNLMLILV